MKKTILTLALVVGSLSFAKTSAIEKIDIKGQETSLEVADPGEFCSHVMEFFEEVYGCFEDAEEYNSWYDDCIRQVTSHQ